MTCPLPSFTARAASLLLVTIVTSRALTAQAPPPVPPVPVPAPAPVSPASAPAPMSLAYRVPAIALVQPPASSGSAGSVPQDRPVVVWRFAAGEPQDPIDLRSLLVTVDGVDRTMLFQVAGTEAWGPLADAASIARGMLPIGAHRVAARICSSRGACGQAEQTVTVIGSIAQSPTVAVARDTTAAATKQSKARRTLDVLVGVGRKLLLP